MELVEKKQPIYDERIGYIQRGLVEGKSREQLAQELGHKSYKTLDIYMRRKNFTWDRQLQNYVPIRPESKNDASTWEPTATSKVALVLALFQKKHNNAKTIAKKLGFTDHRELAAYMRTKGYQWSTEAGNYQKLLGSIRDHVVSKSSSKVKSVHETDMKQDELLSTKEGAQGEAGFKRFVPLLEMLERNKEKLLDLLVPNGGDGTVPRYVLPGIFMTKSVHMTHLLDQLVREYSKEKNISQRDIFAVALIDFFRRYGYESEVERLVGHSRRDDLKG